MLPIAKTLRPVASFFLLLVLSTSLPAQESDDIESLEALLETRLTDSARITILNRLGSYFSDSDSVKTRLYSEEALSLALKVGYKMGEVEAILNLGNSKMVGGKYRQSMTLFRRAYELASQNDYLQGMITALNDLAINFHYVGEMDSTITYFRKSLKLRQVLGDDLEVAKGLSNLGAIFQYKGLYDSSIIYFRQAFKTMEEKGSAADRATVISNIGNIEYEKGKLENALSAYLQALQLMKTQGVQREIARISSNIGVVYSDMGLYTQSLEFQYEALDLYTEIQDEQGVSNCYHEMSNLAIRQEEYSQALNHIIKAIETRERIGYLKGLSESYINASKISRKLGRLEDAEAYIIEALEILRKIQDARNMSASYINLGEIYLEKDNLQAAKKVFLMADSILIVLGDQVLQSQLALSYSNFHLANENRRLGIWYAERAKKAAQESRFPTVFRDAASILASNYAIVGNYRMAFENQKLYKEMDDSLVNLENSRRFARLESQYEFEKKEEKLRSQQEQKEYELEKRNQRNLLTSAGAGITILLVTGFILFQYHQRNKYAKLVEEKNALLSETMASKEKLFSVIAHDLKSPLSAFTSMSSTLAENIDAFQKEQIVTFLKKFEKSSQNLSELLNNLLQWSLSQTGSLSVRKEELNINQIMKNATRPLQDLADSKGIRMVVENGALKASGDARMVETIIRNLVSNALKFTNDGGDVSIGSRKKGDQIEVYVKDSGIGMSQEELSRLFDYKYDPSLIGDHEEKGTGLGLLLSKELVEKNKGSIRVDSEKSGGSIFYFTLPTAA